MTYNAILKKLSNDESLKDYASAIKYLSTASQENKIDFPLDQQITERVAGVFMFEQWAGWEEIIYMTDNVFAILPEHQYLFQQPDFLHTLGGLGVFYDSLNGRSINMSGFPKTEGYEIAFAATQCKKLAPALKGNNPEHAKIITTCYKTLSTIEQAKIDAEDFFGSIKSAWTSQMADGVYNILMKCDPEGEVRLVKALSKVNTDPAVKHMVLDEFVDVYKNAKTKAKAEGDDEKVKKVDKLIKEIKNRFAGKLAS